MGSITAAYGGLVGAYQADIKRILAYSTISHCGFLMLLSSFNINEFVILYLYIHGFFKASVFMCVGNIIRISKNYQDFRRMGLFYKYLPFECFAVFLCLFNLAGLPFSLGFFIKHLIFLGYQYNTWFYYYILFNIFVGAMSGLFYSFRIFFYVFFDFKKGRKTVYTSLNKFNFFSYFYTNTSILSNISIFTLIIVSYVISFYLFCIVSSNLNFISDFSNFSNFSNFYNLFNFKNNFYFFNLSFINWFVLIFAWSLIFLNWRYSFFLQNNYYSFVSINVINIFFLINYQLFFFF